MFAKFICILVGILGSIALAACTPIVSPTPSKSPLATVVVTPESEEVTVTRPDRDLAALAQQDLAARLGVDVARVEVLDVMATTWPDASLGCPQPGMVYAQVEQAGWVIRLQANEQTYFYHSSEGQEPFLCEAMTLNVPRDNEFVPPPGSKID